MRKYLVSQLVLLLTLRALADPTFVTKNVPVNRGGHDGGTVALRFYDDKPAVPYISAADFQQLMLPGTTIGVSKKGEGEYVLKGPYAEATVNTVTEVFSSDDYMGFTNLMGQLQAGMDNVYYDGAPFVRYRSQELTPASVPVVFSFQKYGIDLRGDDSAVYFPLATINDLYSDLYYHIAGYNGEKVIVVTDNQQSDLAKLEPKQTLRVLTAESRSADMAAFSYGQLCFVVDHFYGMPGRSPLEQAIRKDGLDKALDSAENGATIKKLLKSTDMKEYVFGMNCLQMLLDDGGHTVLMPDLLIYTKLEEEEGQGGLAWMGAVNKMRNSYPELAGKLLQYAQSMGSPNKEIIELLRPTKDTYWKQGDTAYLLLNSFGMTNDAAWKAYYDGGCKGATPAVNKNFLGDLSVVLDALKRASDDPEVKNLVVDLSTNGGGSLDVVMAMTALMGGQSHFYSENVLTGQRQIIYYDVDCNFDGKFDEKDKAVKYDLNFAVLTSDIAFSCGNLFPSLMKDMGYPIIGEKSGGGACAVQNFITGEGLQYQLSSSRARLTNNKWQNIDGGVEPTHVIDTKSQGYTGFYDVAAISKIINGGSSAEGDMATVSAKGLYAESDLTLDVTKTADGSIKLYDSKRNIYTVNAAKIPEVASNAEANAIVNDRQKLTAALQDAVTTYARGGQLTGYILKSIRIDEMTSPATGQSLMPTADAPLASLGVVMMYKGTQTVHLWDYVTAGVTGSPIALDHLEAQKRMIPSDGVLLTIAAGRQADGSDQQVFMLELTPDGSGTFAFDQGGIKGEVTYETAGSYMADIHWGMARTYDFYKNVLGRKSYDAAGAPIYNVAFPSGVGMDLPAAEMAQDGFLQSHGAFRAPFGEAVGIIRPQSGQFGAEAMSSYAVKLMAYGTGGISNMERFAVCPAGELSVLCHEFTHLITKSTAQLSSGNNEGGALNESFSDIMAISLMKNADYGNGPETPWVIGGNGLIVGKSNMRNMADPKHSRDGDSPAPDTYKGQYWNNRDKYTMSAVQSYFYYLLCDGGKGTNDNGTGYDVTGIGTEKGTKIAYLTLTKYCSPQSDYSNIRESWLKAAQELYGENGAEAQAVASAWTAVGISGSNPSGIDTLCPDDPQGGQSSAWFTLDGRRLDAKPVRKGVYLHRGKKIVR